MGKTKTILLGMALIDKVIILHVDFCFPLKVC